MTIKNPKLTLVGAGPGNVKLITLQGIDAIAEADVILYDALVNPELLNYAKPEAQTIFVGKRKGSKEYGQDQINEMIVFHAREFGHVVRLKGGDPFVFGRGYEEMEYARKEGIDSDYVPGVSSSIAVAGLQSIPVTYRGKSESFWVVAGTTRTGELSEDIFTAAQTNATVVVLMGLSQLKKIVDVYVRQDKGDLPVAVIQNGSLPNEKAAVGTIDTIEHLVDFYRISSPAIIVIGEVVRLHQDFPNELSLIQSLIEAKSI
jgi:uroporphyrin-III C-methyltransferase